MATENTIKFVAKTNGRSSNELYSLLTVIYDTASLKKPDFGSGPAVVGAADDASPETLNLFITVLAEDDDEVETALNALRVFEIEIVGAPELVSSKPVKPRTVTAPGLDHDEAEGVLTIDTWAPDWTDVEVRLHPNGDGRVVLFLVANEHGRRMEQAVLGNTIKVRGPGRHASGDPARFGSPVLMGTTRPAPGGGGARCPGRRPAASWSGRCRRGSPR